MALRGVLVGLPAAWRAARPRLLRCGTSAAARLQQRRISVPRGAATGELGKPTGGPLGKGGHTPKRRDIAAAAVAERLEYPPIGNRQWRVRRRLFDLAVREGLAPSFPLFGASVCAIICLGGMEGWLLTVPQCADALRLEFAARYSLESLLPSVVWQSCDPHLVARSMACQPASLLVPSITEASGPSDVRLSLLTHRIATLRTIVAPVVTLAQIVQILRQASSAPRILRERIRNGDEPLFPGIQERIVRLCGRKSDVTELSAKSLGEHLVPVLEDTNEAMKVLYHEGTEQLVPKYWRVAEPNYGERFAWAHLGLDESWLLTTSTGRKLLYIEADATNPDAVLTGESRDLSLDDAVLAFRQLVRLADKACGPEARRVRPFRVLLGDTGQLIDTPVPGATITLRQRIDYTHEVDVLVDAKAPVLLALVKWAVRVTSEIERESGESVGSTTDSGRDSQESLVGTLPFSWPNFDFDRIKLLIDAGTEHQFDSLKQVLEGRSFDVAPVDYRYAGDHGRAPYLICHKSTVLTVAAVQALVRAGVVDPSLCCVLIGQEWGARDLEPLMKQSASLGFQVVCAAEIHDKLLMQVRTWARQGLPPHEIQDKLDEMFEPVLKATQSLHGKWIPNV